MNIKALFGSTIFASISIISFLPAKADYIYDTGTSIYGGRSYNYGKYRTAPSYQQRSWNQGGTIQDRDGNLYDCNYGTCKYRN